MKLPIPKFGESESSSVPEKYRTLKKRDMGAYFERLVQYRSQTKVAVRAFLLEPKRQGPHPAAIVYHQHNSEWHFGKSEVNGLVGDRWNAFGPALASKGIVVLIPDCLGFEERRINGANGTRETDSDSLQYYNLLTYSLLDGKPIISKILSDCNKAYSILFHHPKVDKDKIGVLGHSMGGLHALFHAASDERIRFAVSSGALCSYEHKRKNGTGLEFSLVIPGISGKFEIADLVRGVIPRKLLILSATEDEYSMDASKILKSVRKASLKKYSVTHKRYHGGHALDKARFNDVLDWITKAVI